MQRTDTQRTYMLRCDVCSQVNAFNLLDDGRLTNEDEATVRRWGRLGQATMRSAGRNIDLCPTCLTTCRDALGVAEIG